MQNAIEIPQVNLELEGRPARDQIGWDMRKLIEPFHRISRLIDEDEITEASTCLEELDRIYGDTNSEVVHYRTLKAFLTVSL